MHRFAEILATLPLRPRKGLCINLNQAPAADGALLITELHPDPEQGDDAIIGLAVPDRNGGWYLGCTGCHGEIAEEDSGMCQPCRENAALDDLAARDGYEPYDDCDGWDRSGVLGANGNVYSDADPGL
jgi:hypothetical protein